MNFNRYLILLPLAFFLGACPFTTRDEAEATEQKQMREQVSAIQKSRADNELKYNDVQNDIRVVAGHTDALDHNLQSFTKESHQDMDAMKKTIDAQNEKIKVLQAKIDAMDSRLTSALQTLSSGESAAPSKSSDDEGEVKSKKKSKDPSTYEEAENYLSQKEFKKALVKYKDYIDKNPKGKLVGDATYKIGVCFSELGLKKDAKDFFTDVIENYPGTPWAKKAKIRLSKLK